MGHRRSEKADTQTHTPVQWQTCDVFCHLKLSEPLTDAYVTENSDARGSDIRVCVCLCV